MKNSNWRIPKWSSLSGMGHSRVLRSSYLWLFAVPLAAYLLARTGEEIKIAVGESTLIISLGLPFSWKMFYFSAVAFAIASFVYSICCPPVIRDYDGFAAFEAKGGSRTEIIEALFYSVGSDSDTDASSRKLFCELFCSPERGPVNLDLLSMVQMTLIGTKLPDAFHWIRELADQRNLLARLLCSLFYGVGFICIVSVLWQNFLYVCRAL